MRDILKILAFIYMLFCTLFYTKDSITESLSNTKMYKPDSPIESLNITFKQYSKNISKDLVLTDREFEKYSLTISNILSDYFPPESLKNINNIYLLDTDVFTKKDKKDYLGGETQYYNTKNKKYDIYISAKSPILVRILLHEVIHTIYLDNKELFDEKYLDRWNRNKHYISEYAKTNLIEDIAETGSYYLLKQVPNNNVYKAILIQEFLSETYENELQLQH